MKINKCTKLKYLSLKSKIYLHIVKIKIQHQNNFIIIFSFRNLLQFLNITLHEILFRKNL